MLLLALCFCIMFPFHNWVFCIYCSLSCHTFWVGMHLLIPPSRMILLAQTMQIHVLVQNWSGADRISYCHLKRELWNGKSLSLHIVQCKVLQVMPMLFWESYCILFAKFLTNFVSCCVQIRKMNSEFLDATGFLTNAAGLFGGWPVLFLFLSFLSLMT